ncbi:hypothetical protein N8203_01850 [Crocinitomicaceae bacterium]|nr:hypothetical protein [Crocinitomicaceae bacterium]
MIRKRMKRTRRRIAVILLFLPILMVAAHLIILSSLDIFWYFSDTEEFLSYLKTSKIYLEIIILEFIFLWIYSRILKSVFYPESLDSAFRYIVLGAEPLLEEEKQE